MALAAEIILLSDWVIRVILVGVILMRRTPRSGAISWLAFILFVPILGGLFYALVGEARLGRLRIRRHRAVAAELSTLHGQLLTFRTDAATDEEGPYEPVTSFGSAVGMPPLRGNALQLHSQAESTLDAMAKDIDQAQDSCDLLTYIWAQGNGRVEDHTKRISNALCRAAQRGVRCRVLLDSVGSAAFLKSPTCRQLETAGVTVRQSLPANKVRMLFERIDLRNHRKILVIDGRVGYAGSQNITDSSFRSRKSINTGPWIDATVRLEGPAAAALRLVFEQDWRVENAPGPPDREAGALRSGATHAGQVGIVQVLPSGPGHAEDAMRQAMLTAIYSARNELVITTPYFVPDDAMRMALVAAAVRGVHVELVVPAVSDNRLVVAAGRAHYQNLLDHGVRIHHFRGGLLHSKIMTVDRSFTIIGSANMDMRSFFLNLEVTMFVYDSDFAKLARWLQKSYIEQADQIHAADWAGRPWWRVAVGNLAQVIGPLL